MHFNILVFPCGSEIGLEIHRSLKFSRHISLFGANSVDDHGRFVYENYIPDLPFYNEPEFLNSLKNIIQENNIDAIYPAMDAVIAFLKDKETELGCRVIAPESKTTEICLSKSRTYNYLKDVVRVPKIYSNVKEIKKYPVFLKPDIGYGSRGVKKVNSPEEAESHLTTYPGCLILELLPGAEFTVDCFTDRFGKLLFLGARERKRISNGISVNTIPYREREDEIKNIVEKINCKIKFSGAWFVQLKENVNGELSLLEIAARLGGSSSLYRNIGVNFALLSIFNAFDINVDVFTNIYDIELDRALDNKYKLSVEYDIVYCDFDDCLLLGEDVNVQLLSFLYQCINNKKKIILITKHERDINETLKAKRLAGVFDEIIHISPSDRKYMFITEKKAIFIDDSHAERKEVFQKLGIPVFAPDNVECLIK